MSTPVVREDYVKIGMRYASDKMVNTIDRLAPLATTDIEVLSNHCYSAVMLDELNAYGSKLREGSAMCRHLCGERKGARLCEEEAIKEGRLMLRSGIAMAEIAINRRPIPENETPQTTKEIVSAFTAKIKTLGGKNNHDSAKLRTSLETLKATLSEPEFADNAAIKTSVIEFLPKIDATINKLNEFSKAKKSKKDGTKDQYVALDEIIGRAYINLKLLAQVGKAAFTELGDPEHAKLYNINSLRSRHHANDNNNSQASAEPTNSSTTQKIDSLPLTS